MAKIGLTEGFVLIPKGWHVFKITKVTYKEEFGKMEVEMMTVDGQKHIERFSLLGKDGKPNAGAMNAFSYFAKTALDDFKVQEIDEQDLVGHFMRCLVEHEEVESNQRPGKMVTFVRLDKKEPAEGYDDIKIPFDEDEKPAASKPKQSGFDLNALLGKK